MSLPEVTIHGRLVDSPELRFTPNGHAVAKFRVAASERVLDKATNEWKDGDRCFLSVEVWNKAAENVAESLERGTAVIVTGQLRQREYETKEGEKRSAFEVVRASVSVDLTGQIAAVTKSTNGGAGTASSQNSASAAQQPKAPFDEPPF